MSKQDNKNAFLNAASNTNLRVDAGGFQINWDAKSIKKVNCLRVLLEADLDGVLAESLARAVQAVPNTKSRFWSKKKLHRKLKFWSEKQDLGVVDIADFNFLGPKSKFERNWRKRFSNFQNQFPGPKIQNRNRISGFDVPISHFFETKFFKNRNFKFWQSRFLHFHQILTKI